MKKMKMFAVGLLTVMTGLLNVNAAELLTKEADFLSCVTKQTTEDKVTCTLGESITLSDVVYVSGNVTVDLNGKNITPSESFAKSFLFNVLHGGTLTINDATGKGTIGGESALASIFMTKSGGDSTKTATLVVNGGTIEGYYYGIAGNGSTGRENTKIVINGGTVRGLKETDNTGIFNPQNGIVEVNGGTIQGTTAIEMRAGTLTVNGGAIEGNFDELTVKSNGSGTTTIGAGIAIAPHNTNHDITVTITDGTIKGFSALYSCNPENVSNKVTISITGGNFETLNGGDKVVYDVNNQTFISGGTFDKDVTKYTKQGYVSKLINNNYVVAVENKVNVTEVTTGTLTVDKTKAVVGEKVTITVTPNEGYELTTLKVLDKDAKEVSVTDNAFTMPNSEVTITATIEKVSVTPEIETIDPETEVEEATAGVKESDTLGDVLLDSLTETLKDESQKTLADALTSTSAVVAVEIDKIEEANIEETVVEKIQEAAGKATIATYFDINVAVKNASNGEHMGVIPELTEEIELVVVLPEKLKNADKTIKRTYYVIRQHDEEIEKLPATLSEDGNSLIFKSDKFSTYALAYEDNAVTPNPQTFDGIGLYVVLGSLSLISLLVIIINKKKLFN